MSTAFAFMPVTLVLVEIAFAIINIPHLTPRATKFAIGFLAVCVAWALALFASALINIQTKTDHGSGDRFSQDCRVHLVGNNI